MSAKKAAKVTSVSETAERIVPAEIPAPVSADADAPALVVPVSQPRYDGTAEQPALVENARAGNANDNVAPLGATGDTSAALAWSDVCEHVPYEHVTYGLCEPAQAKYSAEKAALAGEAEGLSAPLLVGDEHGELAGDAAAPVEHDAS